MSAVATPGHRGCAQVPDGKKPPEGGFSIRGGPNYLLAAAAAAAEAASATPVAAAAAAEAAESATDEAAAATSEAAAATGAGAAAGAGAGASSFLPQAVRAAAAIRVANRSDLFICILSKR